MTVDSALKREEEETFLAEDREQPVPPREVVAYNELRSCADLFRMYKSGKLEIQPDFQREVVWKADEQSRFIDSLVKQLPIPSMCFSLDYQSQKWKVIDGLQRMSSIVALLGDSPWQLRAVDDIHPALKGKLNTELRNGTEEEKRLYASVEDMSIPITVIRCSYTESSHMRYLFMIFNRLNSGGVRLNNQEIRNCIYSGPFNDFLKHFDKSNHPWQKVKKRIWGPMDRFRSVEVLLRVLAFSAELEKYDGNLAGFLNKFMHANAQASPEQLSEFEHSLVVMSEVSQKVIDYLGVSKRSLTFVEGILVAVLVNSNRMSVVSKDDQQLRGLAIRYASLPNFVDGQRYALSSAAIVKERLRAAIAHFKNA